MSLRSELVQVAAVAVAIVEDLQTLEGAIGGLETRYVLEDVIRERIEQNQKWGAQHHDIQTWLTILMEEVGEAAQAALQEVMFP